MPETTFKVLPPSERERGVEGRGVEDRVHPSARQYAVHIDGAHAGCITKRWRGGLAHCPGGWWWEFWSDNHAQDYATLKEAKRGVAVWAGA